MFGDFKAFVMRGNVVDLAVAVVIGAAFGRIVTSLVDDVLMPPLGLVLGRVDVKELYWDLSGGGHATLAAAEAAGAPVIRYGVFVNHVVSFLVVALAVYLLVRQVRALLPPPAAPPAEKSRDCPFCLSPIPKAATRCRHCSSEVAQAG